MTTNVEKHEEPGSMSTATPTRAPHSDVPTGHKTEPGRVGGGSSTPSS